MDGTSADRIVSGRLLRPASLEFAVTAFPAVVVALLQGRLRLNFANSAGSVETVSMWVGPVRRSPLTILRKDFDLIKKIAQRSTLRLFPSDTLADAEARIRAQVQVEFAGRGVPT